MPQCKGRYARFADRKQFGDGTHYFMVERRCRKSTLPGRDDVCVRCSRRTVDNTLQERLTFDHGLIGEPIPDWSHIYGGAWYEARVEVYGAPDEDTVVWAEEYARVAKLEGDEHKAAERELGMDPLKKKRVRGADDGDIVRKTPGRKKKEPAAAGGAGMAEGQKAAGVEPKAKARAPKAAAATASPKPVSKPEAKPPTYVATHLEKELEALTVDDVEIIRVAPFEYDGRKYFRDERKNKLYKAVAAAPGPYIGRWNPRLSAVETDIPDSDADD